MANEKNTIGKWKDSADESEKIIGGRHFLTCPECNKDADYFVYGTEDWWCGEIPNFCPYCGKDMR